jgi:hypothetical protein
MSAWPSPSRASPAAPPFHHGWAARPHPSVILKLRCAALPPWLPSAVVSTAPHRPTETNRSETLRAEPRRRPTPHILSIVTRSGSEPWREAAPEQAEREGAAAPSLLTEDARDPGCGPNHATSRRGAQCARCAWCVRRPSNYFPVTYTCVQDHAICISL